MPLLPPTVRGPLTPLSNRVFVDGVLSGATVDVYLDGVHLASGGPTASNTGTVSLFGASLTPGGQITATWTLDGETSPFSPHPETVAGLPDGLPAPVFTTPIHSEMDWLGLEGIYPGAEVQVFLGGAQIGTSYASGTGVRVEINTSISIHDVLHAIQLVPKPGGVTVKSGPAESLPAEDWYPREGHPPTPAVVAPIHDCAGAVLVTGAVVGTYVHLHSGGDETPYPAVGGSFWAILRAPAHPPATFAASNHFHRVNRQSATSAAVGIDPAAPLTKPRFTIWQLDCPNQGGIIVTDLTPRAELTFELHNGATITNLGRGGTPDDGTTATFWLPDLSSLISPVPPHSYLLVREKLCALTVESEPCYVSPPVNQTQFPPFISNDLLECSSWIEVNGVYGAPVVVHSDAADWPVLSSAVILPGAALSNWVHLNRPLRGGEKVWVTLEGGCVAANLRKSDAVPVGSLPDLNRIELQKPIYPRHHTLVGFNGALPGARVHVYVNDAWRTSAWWLSSLGAVDAGELHPEDQVRVRQTMCGKNGAMSPPQPVQWGQFDLKASPPQMIRNVVNTITILCREVALNRPFGGLPIAGTNGVGITDNPFLFNATPVFGAAAHFSVSLEGFQTASIDVPIVAPAPPPPANLTIALTNVIPALNKVIKKIDWKLIDPTHEVDKSDSPNAPKSTVQVSLGPTGGAIDAYNLSGSAIIEFTQPGTGTLLSKTVDKFLTINGLQGSIIVQWKGAPLTVEINIGWQVVSGQEIFYFILNKIS